MTNQAMPPVPLGPYPPEPDELKCWRPSCRQRFLYCEGGCDRYECPECNKWPEGETVCKSCSQKRRIDAMKEYKVVSLSWEDDDYRQSASEFLNELAEEGWSVSLFMGFNQDHMASGILMEREKEESTNGTTSTD